MRTSTGLYRALSALLTSAVLTATTPPAMAQEALSPADTAAPQSVELWMSGGWGSAYSGVIMGGGHDRQIAVGAGETRVDTFRLRGPNAWDGRTGEAFGRLEGEMRLVYLPQGCRGDGACRLPDSLAISNVFEVVLN
ncbi:hypothetical protein [Rubrivirga sp.]|uniref:hypothetical protein n=1 Tax=Rubrivirga sp. TaxID=1885344 RepID=UPI003C7852C8